MTSDLYAWYEDDEGGNACTPSFDPYHCSCWLEREPCCWCGGAGGPNECPSAVTP